MFDKQIIAEIGSVHDGSFGNAIKLIELASSAGATAVKFQTHLSAAETTLYAPNPSYFSSEDRYSYFERTSFDISQWQTLKTHAEELGLTFISSAFSEKALDILEGLGVVIHKVPSGEVSNLPLMRAISKTGKPVLLSSGMSNWQELDTAFNILSENCDVSVMQCSSAYPCPPEKVGLNIIAQMMKRYECPVGFSDHTLGYAAPFAAAAMGAICIEKHLTFSKAMYGSDAKHSMEPAEFELLSQGLREIWSMLESPVDKDNLNAYSDMKQTFEKSIVARHDLLKGHLLTIADIDYKKPGTGLSTNRVDEVLNRRLIKDLQADEQITFEVLIDET
jgi:N,N'-diacetyllegionaminate synthase